MTGTVHRPMELADPKRQRAILNTVSVYYGDSIVGFPEGWKPAQWQVGLTGGSRRSSG